LKRKNLFTIILTILLSGVVITSAVASNDTGPDLARVRDATAKFHDLQDAMAAGYNLVPGLDYCFDNPPVGGMGYHYINGSLLDTVVELQKPEALVYAPGSQGKLELAAVEYIVPIAAWDASNAQPPMLLGRTFEPNQTLGVYTLHAWIWKHNSLGMFNDWNPKVSCNPG
jgi:hypothetical protein